MRVEIVECRDLTPIRCPPDQMSPDQMSAPIRCSPDQMQPRSDPDQMSPIRCPPRSDALRSATCPVSHRSAFLPRSRNRRGRLSRKKGRRVCAVSPKSISAPRTRSRPITTPRLRRGGSGRDRLNLPQNSGRALSSRRKASCSLCGTACGHTIAHSQCRAGFRRWSSDPDRFPAPVRDADRAHSFRGGL